MFLSIESSAKFKGFTTFLQRYLIKLNELNAILPKLASTFNKYINYITYLLNYKFTMRIIKPNFTCSEYYNWNI